MHMMLLGETQLSVFQVEHAELEREMAHRRMVREAREARAEKAVRSGRTSVRGFIPRVAGALGLF